jgi:hypothetical protein
VCGSLSVSELREGAGSGRSGLILVLFFFPFLCGAVSGSNLLLFGGASDDEQGSKDGDHRRGEFHSFGKILLRS